MEKLFIRDENSQTKEVIKPIKDLENNVIKAFGDEAGGKFFNEFMLPFLQLRLEIKNIKTDLESFKDLFINIVLPQSRQFYFELLDLNEESPLLKVDDKYILAKENEMLQLAYVGLFHKIENYENKILEKFNQLANTNYKNLEKIGIDFKKKELFNDRNRIRLICNSVKHNDAYPKKDLLSYYPEMKLEMKLTNSHLNFKKDIELILAYITYFNLFITTKLLENNLNDIDSSGFESLKNETSKFINLLSINESYKDPEFEEIYLTE